MEHKIEHIDFIPLSRVSQNVQPKILNARRDF